jgi:hypothetical protein
MGLRTKVVAACDTDNGTVPVADFTGRDVSATGLTTFRERRLRTSRAGR